MVDYSNYVMSGIFWKSGEHSGMVMQIRSNGENSHHQATITASCRNGICVREN